MLQVYQGLVHCKMIQYSQLNYGQLGYTVLTIAGVCWVRKLRLHDEKEFVIYGRLSSQETKLIVIHLLTETTDTSIP